MQRLLSLIVIVGLTTALSSSVEAGVRKARHVVSRHHAGRPRSRHHIVEMSDVGRVRQAPYPALATFQPDDRLHMSLEHRFGQTGVVGALGYNRGAGAHRLDPNEVNSAASTQLGSPDDTVGAKVSIPF
jgi:hypothetical protein